MACSGTPLPFFYIIISAVAETYITEEISKYYSEKGSKNVDGELVHCKTSFNKIQHRKIQINIHVSSKIHTNYISVQVAQNHADLILHVCRTLLNTL
jgi:hypothetical protein